AAVHNAPAGAALETQAGLQHKRLEAARSTVGRIQLRLGEPVPLEAERAGVMLVGDEPRHTADDGESAPARAARPGIVATRQPSGAAVDAPEPDVIFVFPAYLDHRLTRDIDVVLRDLCRLPSRGGRPGRGSDAPAS